MLSHEDRTYQVVSQKHDLATIIGIITMWHLGGICSDDFGDKNVQSVEKVSAG